MSIKCQSHVWEHSQQKGSTLLVLLAIADYAHDDGTGAWPSIATLARKSRMTRRNVQLVIRQLERSKELKVRCRAGPHRCNMYEVKLPKSIGVKITQVKSSASMGETRPRYR